MGIIRAPRPIGQAALEPWRCAKDTTIMSVNKMLIDATHPEETRVVVLKQGRVEEFDYESAARKQLRGNIYLAKVTRVEPSLQAAFVEYGGNRHGFLAFSEIHPDYYQIPMADRQALLEQEAMAEAEAAAADDAEVEDIIEVETTDADESDEEDIVSSNEDDDDDADDGNEPSAQEDVLDAAAEDDTEGDEDDTGAPTSIALASDSGDAVAVPLEGDNADHAPEADVAPTVEEETATDAPVDDADASDVVDQAAQQDEQPDVSPDEVGEDDALEELEVRPRRRPRSYKIQEVIKRRQVILVQVVKEERGNKGAALTTYMSLAGRYTVLMPNTARGGGISRKITNPQDRKRLKAIANELDVPEGMGLIVRTAGASRTKQELRRDFEYLLRLWESVRDLTLESSAPSLVYEEGNLIKRSIRDLYNKEIDEVLVAGDKAYKQAKDFMRMLMPSHAKNVIHHQKSESLFTIFGIERQLNAMFSPQVTLRSGGYLIINQTEALVAVDVNSGKSTREFSIEETALATNLEAATEIARQLKLRDLAGLVVIDFIDMDERRNNRAVERRLKEALRHDRARIQFGRISHFGLMEMSRQRLRTGVLEGSTSQCPHCQGTGIIRSTDSVALSVLRAIEDAVLMGEPASIVATTSPEAAIYILNNKRGFINEIEDRHGISVTVKASDKMQGANFTIGKVTDGPAGAGGQEKTVVNMDWGFEPEPPQDTSKDRRRGRGRGRGRNGSGGGDRNGGNQRNNERNDDQAASGDEQKPRRRRRRRGRRSDQDQDQDVGEGQNGSNATSGDDHLIAGEGPQPDVNGISSDGDRPANTASSDGDGDETRKPRRRRGRRGGTRGRGRGRDASDSANGGTNETQSSSSGGEASAPDDGDKASPDTGDASAAHENTNSRPKRSPRAQSTKDGDHAETQSAETSEKSPPAPKPRRRSTTSSAPKVERVVVTPDESSPAEPAPPTAGDAEPRSRSGWWNRGFGRK